MYQIIFESYDFKEDAKRRRRHHVNTTESPSPYWRPLQGFNGDYAIEALEKKWSPYANLTPAKTVLWGWMCKSCQLLQTINPLQTTPVSYVQGRERFLAPEWLTGRLLTHAIHWWEFSTFSTPCGFIDVPRIHTSFLVNHQTAVDRLMIMSRTNIHPVRAIHQCSQSLYWQLNHGWVCQLTWSRFFTQTWSWSCKL